MARIEDAYLNICKAPAYNISADDLYAGSCLDPAPTPYSSPDLFSYKDYIRAKNIAFADINYEFLNAPDNPPEIQFEGYIVAWLLQREAGWENSDVFTLGVKKFPLELIISDALTWFTNPRFFVDGERTLTKKNYWQIRQALILLEHIDVPAVQAFFARYNDFFKLGYSINPSISRKENMLNILAILEKKARSFGDPILSAEIKFKIGILLNEQGKYQEAKPYFQEAQALAKSIAGNPAAYRANHVNNRVELIVNLAIGQVITDYYQAAEMYRVLSSAHKILAAGILLEARDGQEIPLEKLKEALSLTEKAEAFLNEPSSGHRDKGPVYKYFAEVYGMLDLERLRGDILARLGLLLKDSCPEQSKIYIDESFKVFDKIIAWEKSFQKDREKAIKDKKGAYKLHPHAPGKGIAVFSEWGADIIGNAHLAKARLLMSIYPKNPAKPKEELKEAQKHLDEAGKYLLKPDDYNFLSARAEYAVRMNIESSPKELTAEIRAGKQMLEELPGSFVYSKLWLARVYIKEERFADAENLLKKYFDPANPNDPNNPYRPVMTPQLKSSIYQIYAELALEDEELSKASAFFTKAACWHPYNFYAQIGLADLANWSGNYTDAEKIYEHVLADPRIPVNVKKRVELGLAEVALRRRTLQPGMEAAADANAVIEKSKAILEKSDELFMLEHALQSLVEAVIAKKEAGLDELNKLRDNLLNGHFNISTYLGKKTALDNPEIKDRVKADLYLKIADGYFFTQDFDGAKKILDSFENSFKGLLAKDAGKPAVKLIKARYLFAQAEVAERRNPCEPESQQALKAAAKQFLSLPEAKRDPLFCERVLKDLINLYVNTENYEAALALIFAVQKKNPGNELEKLSGKLSSSRFDAAANNAADILKGVDFDQFFKGKALDRRLDIFTTDLLIKQAEILTWTKNFPAAQKALKDVYPRKKSFLQEVRVLIVIGNILTRRKKDRDYKNGLGKYSKAEQLITKELTAARPGQELTLVRAELYLGMAGVYNFGRNGVRNLETASKYYNLAEASANEIKGNDNLKLNQLARIHLGRAVLEQMETNPEKAQDYFERAEDEIGRACRAESELSQEIDRLGQSILEPQLKLFSRFFSDPSSMANQTGLTLQLPLYRGRLVPYFYYQNDSSYGPSGNSNVNTPYAGLKVKLAQGRLTLDGRLQVMRSRFTSDGLNGAPPNFFRRPTAALGATYWNDRWVGSISGEFYYNHGETPADESRLNSYYASGMRNFAHRNNPYLDVRTGPVISTYPFIYQGTIRNRYFAGWGVDWAFDLAEIRQLGVPYNFVQLRANTVIPFYEHERYRDNEYEPRLHWENRSILDGEVPLRAGLELRVNLGSAGMLVLSGEGNYQRTSLYEYQNVSGGVAYQTNFDTLWSAISRWIKK